MNSTLKNIGSFALRFILSVGLLWWLFSHVDFATVTALVKQSDPGYMVLAGLVFFAINAVLLWRWFVLMKAIDLKVKRFDSIRWFLIGQFCNLFLPTSIGGDVVKGLGLAKITGNKPKVFASLVLDRLSGFAGIVLVAVIALFFGHKIVQDTSVIWSIVIMAVVSLMIAAVLFSRRIFSFACRMFTPWPTLKNALMNVHHDLVLMRGKLKQGVLSIALSIVAQLILALAFYLTAKAMGQEIDFVYFIIFSPLVCVATSLPSIGGLGVREIGWVYLLAKVGVEHNVSIGLSLINFMFMVIVGLIGGLFYVFTLSSRRVQHHQTDSSLSRSHT